MKLNCLKSEVFYFSSYLDMWWFGYSLMVLTLKLLWFFIPLLNSKLHMHSSFPSPNIMPYNILSVKSSPPFICLVAIHCLEYHVVLNSGILVLMYFELYLLELLTFSLFFQQML